MGKVDGFKDTLSMTISEPPYKGLALTGEEAFLQILNIHKQHMLNSYQKVGVNQYSILLFWICHLFSQFCSMHYITSHLIYERTESFNETTILKSEPLLCE